MIHWAYNFCAAVEQYQGNSELDVNLIQATKHVVDDMNTDLILRTRDSLRELAKVLENYATERNEED